MAFTRMCTYDRIVYLYTTERMVTNGSLIRVTPEGEKIMFLPRRMCESKHVRQSRDFDEIHVESMMDR